MKSVKYLRAVWRAGCEMWQLDWEDFRIVDNHTWERQGEIRQRLHGSHHNA